jgi:hypothetical protein
LEQFYGWDIGDLERVIRAQLLKQKLIPLYDSSAKTQGETVLEDILSGADFSKAAQRHSDDEFTKNDGGQLGYIQRGNTEIPPQIVEAAFLLEEGQTADELAQTLFGYHIVKTIDRRGENEVLPAHILFRFEDPAVFINVRKEQIDIIRYIQPPEVSPQLEAEEQ